MSKQPIKPVALDKIRLHGKRPTPPQTAPQRLKLLVTIVNRNKAEFFMDLLQSQEINVQLALAGEGTASTDMLQLLGLADSEKSVIFSLFYKSILYQLKIHIRLLSQRPPTVMLLTRIKG